MRNIALRLSYDGTRYHGWQEQRSDVTVAGTLTRAVNRVCGDVSHITGCGRTDAGVHAERYCANFRTESTIPAERLPYAINTLLPADIAVSAAIDAPEDFNAVLSCEKKEYIYKIVCSRLRDPFLNGRAYFYPKALDIDAMGEAAGHFVGTHDFAAVRSVGTETKTTVRTVHWFEISRGGENVEMRVCADGFLYNMARAMVGTLIYVSEGKIRAEEIPALLETRDRRLAGPTVPPWGLYLAQIWYAGAVGEMMR
ncbi:MAG: tRNA pseudouridine(38-40) synthase TruA [Oscillospiraceae bacterium]|jgi:tRNA pseudouridine38-40 synthase|nr:tRNA pseudouridine(38-40) synthase TruA [Oscillospiraceae bacterium]